MTALLYGVTGLNGKGAKGVPKDGTSFHCVSTTEFLICENAMQTLRRIGNAGMGEDVGQREQWEEGNYLSQGR